LIEEVHLSHDGAIGICSLGVFISIGTWLENYVHQSGMHLDSFRGWVLTIGKKAKVSEDAVNEANLSEQYAVDEVG